jgi:hypothetical protein
MFRSMPAKAVEAETNAAASARASGSDPKSWMNCGALVLKSAIISKVRLFLRRSPSAAIISVTSRPQPPISSMSCRRTRSVSPAMGARTVG